MTGRAPPCLGCSAEVLTSVTDFPLPPQIRAYIRRPCDPDRLASSEDRNTNVEGMKKKGGSGASVLRMKGLGQPCFTPPVERFSLPLPDRKLRPAAVTFALIDYNFCLAHSVIPNKQTLWA